MKKIYSILMVVFFFLPFWADAAQCSSVGYTIATVNGIFSTENDARNNMEVLMYVFDQSFNGEPINFQYLYNPTHLAGLGDLADSAYQKYFENETVTDYDLIEMIKSAAIKVNTQKLLLVAHSQGNFYANSFYDSVADKAGGIPAQSLGIFAVATPASRIAGNGSWLTSDTDKVIAGLVSDVPGRKIMPPNTHIVLGPDDSTLGHDFSSIYLKYRGPEIVSAIRSSLQKLKSNEIQDRNQSCITAAPAGLVHNIEGAILLVTDPVSGFGGNLLVGSVSAIYNAGSLVVNTASNTLASVGSAVVNTLNQMPLSSTALPSVYQIVSLATAPVITTADIFPTTSKPTFQNIPAQTIQPTITSSAVADLSIVATSGATATVTSTARTIIDSPISVKDLVATNNSSSTTSANIIKNDQVVAIDLSGYQAVPLVYLATPIADSHPIPSVIGGDMGVDIQVPTTVSQNQDHSDLSSLIDNNSSTSTSDDSSTTTATSSQDDNSATSTDDQSSNVDPSLADHSDTIAPGAPIIVSPVATIFATTEIIFSGTAEASSTIFVNLGDRLRVVLSVADSAGNWSLKIDLPDGANHLDFFAEDGSGNISNVTSRDILIDTASPDISLSIAECQKTISPNSCLVMSPNLHISWNSSADDLDHFILNQNGVESVTTATSTSIVILNDSSYTVSIFAVDHTGNKSPISTKTVYVSQTPVVINELAWGGTAAHADDEWIELYNRSSQAVDLSGFTLYSKTDMSPYIQLVGIIPSRGYFLIEAKNTGETNEATESSVKNIVADLWTSFGARLSNTGEDVILSFASTTVDEIPYCYNWCGVPATRTTERFDPDSSGNDQFNWSANTAVIVNGQDANGGSIIGTPRARNSLNYMINRGQAIAANKNIVLKKSGSPYFIDGIMQKINDGGSLTIEPGVVIKFRNAWLSADGNIIANGTVADPIIFTAFTDDNYGGDLDNASATPIKGSWYGIELSNKSIGSSFVNNIFRYGGNYGQGAYTKAMLYVGKTSPVIKNSIFEYSKAYGVYLDGSNSTTTNNIFRYNSGDPYSNGLYAYQGAPIIDSNSFIQNSTGAYLISSNANIINNSFSGNSSSLWISGLLGGQLTGNSGGSSDKITLSSSLGVVGATTTIVANPLPYFIYGNVSIPVGAIVDLREGTIFKTSTLSSPSLLNVFGKLNIDTSTTSGVMFLADNPASGRSGWQGIYMNPGSSSKIKGATISNGLIGIKYISSPISLENVIFSTNTTAVSAQSSPVLKASNIIFSNNGVNKDPSNLW